jgi:prepilin-type N-terminal cleavage/methylation domain-containing protein
VKRAPHGRRAPGFTLVEVIVALTATVLVAGAVYLTASTALASAERNRAVQREARTQRNARMVLTALLRSARADVVTEDARFMGVDAAHAPSGSGSGSDELQLVGALGFPFARYPTGEPLRVRLWLGATPGAGRALLMELAPYGRTGLQPWPRPHRGGDAGGADTVVLFAHLDGAEIRYRDPVTSAWLDSWDRPGLLPAAVAIELRSVAPLPPLVVNLPRRRTR